MFGAARTTIALYIISAAVYGCGGGRNETLPVSENASPDGRNICPSNIDLTAMQEQIRYGNLTVYIDSNLWVNDQPITSGNDFNAGIKLLSLEGDVPVNNITNIELYILQNGFVLWCAQPDEQIRTNTVGGFLEIMFRNGPSSLRNQIVDVAIEFQFNNEIFSIKQENVNVGQVF